MSTNVVIKDTATPILKQAAEKGFLLTVMQGIAKSVEVLLKKHFQERQAEGNKRNWPLPKFWYGAGNTMANATGVGLVNAQQATISVDDDRFNQKVFGGTITAKRAGSLAIPLTAEAARQSAIVGTLKEIPDLVLIKTRKGAYLAKESYQAHGSKSGQRLQFWFKLTKSITQAADPRALPLRERIDEAVETAATKAYQLLSRRSGGANA